MAATVVQLLWEPDILNVTTTLNSNLAFGVTISVYTILLRIINIKRPVSHIVTHCVKHVQFASEILQLIIGIINCNTVIRVDSRRLDSDYWLMNI